MSERAVILVLYGKGDPESGIAPGTAFEDIPDDWVCPVCGLYKDSFKIVEEK